MLTEQEKKVVRRLAGGDNDARHEAEPIYYAHVKAHVESGRKSPEMNFLSEMFNVCPDYMLKSIYRKQVLAQK